MALTAAYAVSVFASLVTLGSALGVDTQKIGKAEEIVIPEWKLDLATGKGGDWWSKFGVSYISNGISSAIWGESFPAVTGSPAQNHQRCPVIKLPDTFVIAAKERSWTSLFGEWSTNHGVRLATWEQNYFGMGFSRDIKRVSVYFRAASSGDVAIRTRYFTDKEMLSLFDWKESSQFARKKAKSTEDDENKFNLAILDCSGTLMYVVKETEDFPKYVQLYSRDGQLVAQTLIGSPVLKYQFTDPVSGYLIASAEAPGINASIKLDDIPRDVEIGSVLPFGVHFEAGGYKNSSALMDPDYRWIIAAGVQALDIYKAQAQAMPWGIITVVEILIIAGIALAVLVLLGILFAIYRLVYPANEYHYYGKKLDNPFLMAPECPPPRNYGANQ